MMDGEVGRLPEDEKKIWDFKFIEQKRLHSVCEMDTSRLWRARFFSISMENQIYPHD